MAPSAPSGPSLPPPEGDLRDIGAARRPAIRARSYTALGAVRIDGDVDTGTVELHGTATIGGRLSAERLRSDGDLDVAREVVVKGESNLRGPTSFGASLVSGDLVVQGTLRVAAGAVVDGDARITGTLEVGTSLSARSVAFEGALVVPVVLECPFVQGRLRRPSRIGTLRSQNVRIVRAPGPLGRHGTLVGDRIEASEVELAGVDCEYLRAERVRLGPDAHVTRLDGQVVRQHRTATVGPRSWTPAPPGLTR